MKLVSTIVDGRRLPYLAIRHDNLRLPSTLSILIFATLTDQPNDVPDLFVFILFIAGRAVLFGLEYNNITGTQAMFGLEYAGYSRIEGPREVGTGNDIKGGHGSSRVADSM
jgi:hypothetical protein